MSTALELLSHLRSLDVRVWAEGDRLRFSAPAGALTPALRSALGEHKAELLALLRETSQRARPPGPPVAPVERSAPAPLSFAQQRLWFLDQLDPGNPAYNVYVGARLAGALDAAALAHSLNAIVRRHEALRTRFPAADGRPMQVVDPPAEWPLLREDLQYLPAPQRETALRRITAAAAAQPFDLARGPLIRGHLIQLGPFEHVLLLMMHHIVSDGWSLIRLFRELSSLYAAHVAGQPAALAELPVQYADFAAWQRHETQGEALAEQLAYWGRQLGGGLPLLELPFSRPRPPAQSFRGATRRFAVPQAIDQALVSLGRRERATVFMTLLAAFKALLYRYTGQTDLGVGTPVAGRSQAQLEPLIGFFINTLVLRTNLSGGPTFRELLGRVREVALQAYAHQDVPFEQIVEQLQPERTLSYQPLFQVMLVLQDAPLAALELPGVAVQPFETGNDTAKFDLTLYLEQDGLALSGAFEYNVDLFDHAVVERMAGHFLLLLEGIVANPDRPLHELPLLTQAERRDLLVGRNTPLAAYPVERCLHRLFELQAERTPDAVAVTCEGHQLTYRELNSRANRLARHLRGKNVGPEVPVGICVERSLELVVGVLGVLKAGGAYVPLDPRYPKERLAFMLHDSRAPVLLTQAALLGGLPPHRAQTVCLDAGWDAIAAESDANLDGVAPPSSLAYIIYTSGSTGRPKGVMVSHANVARLFAATEAWYGFGQRDVWTLFHSYAFDFSVWELWGALLYGGRLVVVPYWVSRSPEACYELLRREGVTVLNQTPSAFRQLARADELAGADLALRLVIFGGEALEFKSLQPWFDRHGHERPQLVNMYGITETTVHATYRPLAGDDPARAAGSLLGRRLPDLQVYVLDQHMQPVPAGVAGELYIGGAGVARGYWGRPELTAERFRPDPFGAAPGGRLYRSGDLARYLPDGDLEYLGRSDHQVKIRGHRIELGEIEAALGSHPEVRELAVVAREEPPDARRIVAYVAPAPGASPSATGLRAFLKERLPEYMLPAAFVLVDRLPLTANGKLDRLALPAPDYARPEGARATGAPRTREEALLAQIWSQVLRVGQVGVHDNFFELGGDSILSIQIIARANQAGLRLTPRQLFQYQTVAELAALADVAPAAAEPAAAISGPVPLTPIQRWFFDRQLPDPHHWNQAVALDVQRALDAAVLERAINALLAHHDALRLRFERAGAGWRQWNAGPDDELALRTVDLSALAPEAQARMVEHEAARLQTSLDLSRGPLFGAALFDFGPQRARTLLLVAHHLVIDGVSWRILLEDLDTAYGQLQRGEPVRLPAKTTAFKHWAERLAEHARSGALPSELAYWRDDAGIARAARLPLDIAGGPGANTEASARSVVVALSGAETRALLQEVPAAYRTQINDVLLAALVEAFAPWTGERALLVDLEGHGREDVVEGADLSRTVGWFTTIFPVLLDPGDAAGPGDRLRAVKEQLRRVPRRGIGYGLLRFLSGDARITEQLAALPSPEVSFNYLGQFDQLLPESSAFRLARLSGGADRSPQAQRAHLLEVGGRIMGGQLFLEWVYSDRAHTRATIAALAERFLSSLRALIAHCQSAGAGRHTPPDFPLLRIDQPTLDRLARAGGPIEDIYPLAPGQQEMLAATLRSQAGEAYVVQWSCTLRGALDLRALRDAWQRAVDRHPVLRTAFAWGGLDEPLQLVERHAELPWEQHDWRGAPDVEQRARLEQLLGADLARGFDLARAPLMRLAVVRLSDERHWFLWSHHHLVQDGWSMPLLWREAFSVYAGLRKGQHVFLEPARPYRDYVAWAQGQSVAAARAFWQRALEGFVAPNRLGASAPPGGLSGGEAYAEQRRALPESATAALRSFAQRHRLTMNTLVQGAWALLLGARSGASSVVFGVTLAGRPVDLAQSEAMVGLLINTLPLRVELDPASPLLAWLRAIQDRQAELRQYEYTSLAALREWVGLPPGRPLFESIVRFQNHPRDLSPGAGQDLPAIEEVRWTDRWHYPLSLIAVPGAALELWATYDRRRFDAGAAQRLLAQLQATLERFVGGPAQRLADVLLELEQDGRNKALY